MKYLVCYDLGDDKKRKKLSDLLENYGFRVNYSVFEIDLNKSKLNKLLNEIDEKHIYNKNTDSIRFYHICKNCIPKSFELSNRSDIFEEEELFF